MRSLKLILSILRFLAILCVNTKKHSMLISSIANPRANNSINSFPGLYLTLESLKSFGIVYTLISI